MKNFKIKSYCKINLSLRVIKKLNNNYHNIISLITFCDLHDVISISKTKSLKDKISFSGKFKKGINKKSNTVTKILNLLRRAKLLGNQAFKINIQKNIPHGSGLGGGSSNAADLLNYLAYSWIDRGIKLDKGLKMLKKATELRKNDGYIIDSLGWAYYAKKNYIEAEFFLQKAVELLPSDPIINDHYADTLWMLNKNIQARYIWNNILKLNSIEQKMKDAIRKKLIFGITTQL